MFNNNSWLLWLQETLDPWIIIPDILVGSGHKCVNTFIEILSGIFSGRVIILGIFDNKGPLQQLVVDGEILYRPRATFCEYEIQILYPQHVVRHVPYDPSQSS